MTEQERQLISGLADRVGSAPAPQIDKEADDLIKGTIGARPDALYILTQTVLIQEMALNQAKAQIDELKQRTASPQLAPQSGFLHGQPNVWSHESRPPQPAYSAPPPPPYGAPQPAPPSSGGFGSFLRSAATTAAGVVAGEIAFDSLASLFGHHGGGGFFGSGFGGGGGFFGGGGGISPGSETIVNNYYGDDQQGSHDDSQLASDDSDMQNTSADVDNSGDDQVDNGDDLADDTSADDGGSVDDGGGSFDV